MPQVQPPPQPTPAQPADPASETSTLRRLALPVLALAVAVGFVIVATLRWDIWIGNRAVQSTDDAYVRAETTRLSSRVAGEVKSIAVSDFQRVKAGDLLLQIDRADYEAQLAQAEAGVAGAQATAAVAWAMKRSVWVWPGAVKVMLLNVTLLPTSVPPVLLLTNCMPVGSSSVRM